MGRHGLLFHVGHDAVTVEQRNTLMGRRALDGENPHVCTDRYADMLSAPILAGSWEMLRYDRIGSNSSAVNTGLATISWNMSWSVPAP